MSNIIGSVANYDYPKHDDGRNPLARARSGLAWWSCSKKHLLESEYLRQTAFYTCRKLRETIISAFRWSPRENVVVVRQQSTTADCDTHIHTRLYYTSGLERGWHKWSLRLSPLPTSLGWAHALAVHVTGCWSRVPQTAVRRPSSSNRENIITTRRVCVTLYTHCSAR